MAAEASSSDRSDQNQGKPPSEEGGFGLSSFLGHLSELSNRLKKSLFAYIVVLAVISSIPDPLHPFGGSNSFYGYNFLLADLIRVAETTYAPGVTFIAQSPADPVFAFLNLSMVAALLISLPYIFYQIYGFVAPGLYQREKRAVRKYILPFSLLLAIGGIFGLLIVFPIVMKILLLFFPVVGVGKYMAIDYFVNFLTLVPLVTGLAFTFPVFIIPLVELRVLRAQQLSSARKWVYVGFALAVSIANPDPTDLSSIPIIVPIFVLYEITIYIAKRIEKNRAAKSIAQGLAPP
ncbi:MAG: twin-arginine translocase subunit TatC [archaeon]|nr:twin-arginine translocase subunit TatC [archaeon]